MYDRDFDHAAEKTDEAALAERIEELLSVEPEIIESVLTYQRNGQTELGKQELIERIDYLISRAEANALHAEPVGDV